MGARYRAPPPGHVLILSLDPLTAIYHRASGQTHVVAPPVPEMLALLVDPLTPGELLAALGERYDLPDGDVAALTARLDELAAIGLVTRDAI
ncbi:HPr-rel-A system PqqD family peptide chaperone [Sphingomonas lacusdianchii]|uniref:HPr-rel-A system PqqD family peptide chaperone n=1 Tax=Sphingomonas lacusdianchii TaxID=2917992 RepID=UPI001F57AFA0|nr:HPr-rel-A system PqqD family peptide chaperone [Sphingomonas sp. JXJ CY 53]